MKTNNEDTIFLNEYLDELKKSEKKIDIKSLWKPVSIGGISAIMLGIGTYAIGNMGRGLFHVDDSKSFEDAFDEARKELGSDGVFQYKDGAYIACSPDEWDEKSDAEKVTAVAHLIPEDYLDVDLSSIENDGHHEEQVVANDVNENVEPLNVEVKVTPVEKNEQKIDISVVDEPAKTVSSDVETVSDNPDVVMVSGEDESELLTDEIEVTLVDETSVEEDNSIVGKIIEEIAELIVPESEKPGPAPLEASKAVEIDSELSVNPDVAPDMPDYMQDADLSSIL